jgi:TrmH family RNA methyltransferase
MSAAPPDPTPAIASPANPRVKALVRLRDRAERDRVGRTLVDGIRETVRALDAGLPIDAVYAGPGVADRIEGRELLARLAAAGVPIVGVSAGVAERIAYGSRSDGVVAVVTPPSLDLGRLSLPRPAPLVLVLDGIEKPGNVGAALRSADGAGADAVVLSGPRTDPWNPNAIRASLGTILSVPVAAAASPLVVDWCRAEGLAMVAARVGAARSYTSVDLRGPCAIVLGSEAGGLGAAWATDDVVGASIPMRGRADSLNVSVAAAVFLYEARRQRDG